MCHQTQQNLKSGRHFNSLFFLLHLSQFGRCLEWLIDLIVRKSKKGNTNNFPCKIKAHTKANKQKSDEIRARDPSPFG